MRTENEYVRCDGFCIFHCTRSCHASGQCPCAIFALQPTPFGYTNQRRPPVHSTSPLSTCSTCAPRSAGRDSRISCVTSTRSGLYIHGSPQREQKSSTSAAACTLPARNSTKRPRHLLVRQVVRDCGRLADRPASMPGSSWSDARWHGARE